MRLVLLCALVASAAFAATSERLRWSSEPKSSIEGAEYFRAGNEYRFHFDQQIASGLPVPGSQHALTRIQALVSLVFPDERSALLQIQKIRVGSEQKEISEPKKMHPFELTKELELNEEHLRQLRQPVLFRYENGLISEIEFDREEHIWSANIKRSILNFLQVNLNKKNVVETPYETETIKGEESFFTAPERMVEGECEVAYTILPLKEGKIYETRVTKSVDFEKCASRVGTRYNFRFGENCPSCENKYQGEERNVKSSTVLNYRIVGSGSRFLLREVELRSQYVYQPLNQENTFFTTTISGKLQLVEIVKEESRLPTPKSEKKESMLYNTEWEQAEEKFLAEGDETLLRHMPFPEIMNKPEIVEKLIKAIIAKFEKKETGVELIATHEFARLVRVLRYATKTELSRIHKEVYDNEKFDKEIVEQMREIITDALAVAGSANTVEHLIEKMRTRTVSPLRTATLFKHLTNINTPSEKIIESLVSLCKEQKRQPLERQSCWLTVGALVNGVCGEHRDRLARTHSEKNTCPRTLKQKFVRELTELFERAETRYEKILALKTIANSGMDLIVFPLEKIIKDERMDKTIRIQAIDALRKLRMVMPRKIQSILMPLFKNHRETPELRVAAFNQIMQTLPERAVIDQIAEQLMWEPSHQVHAFVYTALHHYAKSEIPCEKTMAEDIKSSLSFARIQPRKMIQSHYRHYSTYNKESEYGAIFNWATLFSNDSVLPKEVMTSLETVFGGVWNKYLAQIGFSQHNIDQVLSKLVKKIEEQGIEEIVVRGKRSSSFRPTELLRGLFSKLSITSRKQMEQDPHALVYIRFRDLDYALLPIDEEVIPEMIKSLVRNGRIELGEIEHVLAKGYRFSTTFSTFVYEHSRKVMTSAGLPLVISTKMPTVTKVQGVIKAELTPKNGKTFEGARVHIAAEPTVASTHVTDMEIVFPIVNHGVKLLHSAQMNVPVDVAFEMNWEKKMVVKTTVTLPKESRRLIQLQTRPTTFVRVWPKSTRTYVEPKEKTIFVNYLETLVKKIDTSFFEQSTGMKINVVGHVHGHIFEQGIEKMPAALLIGENNIDITFEKTEETPKEYVMKVELENFNEEERMEKPEHFERFFEEKEVNEHFEMEETEYVEEKEHERRASFKTYLKNYKGGKAYKHRFFTKIHSVGGRKERMVEFELTSICDEKMRNCKIELLGERTPLGEERKNWEIKSVLRILYPEMPETLEGLLVQKHRELSTEWEAVWGSEEKNTLKVKVQGEQNKEQKKWMKRAIELKNLKGEEKMTTFEEYSQLLEASMLNQYKVVAKYDIECPMTLRFAEKLYSIVKAYTPFMWTNIEFVKNEPRVVRVVLSLEPETRQFANLTVETPRERLVLSEMRLPFPLRLVNIHRHPSTPVRSLTHIGSMLTEETRAECVVESNKVNTFDNVFFRAPLTTCYSVLAKDCSSEQPMFAVLMKMVEKKSEEKKMKIISKEYVIELEQLRDSEKIMVTVNGDEIKSEERLENFRIYKNGQYVTVELEDLKVHFDGYTAQIKMSEYYKNKQCGVCGHYDDERDNEFRRADYELTEDMESFHRSFLVKGDEECVMEEDKLREKKNYAILSEESSSSEESVFEERKSWEKKSVGKKVYPEETKYEREIEVIEPIMKTRMVEYSNKVCFSMEALPECPRKSFEKETKSKSVEFACMPRSAPEASRLIRKAHREILSLEEFPVSFTEGVMIPKMCVVY